MSASLPPPLVGSDAPPRFEALLVPLGAFLVFLSTWSAVHSWDSIAFTARAQGDPLLSDTFLSTTLLHPHHLLYVPLAQLFIRLAGGLSPDPFAPLLLLSSLAGAGVVALGGWLARRVSSDRVAGLAAMAILTLANTTWLYATHAEVMMPAIFFLLLGCAALAARFRGAAALAGFSVALGILVHQIVALYAIALVVVLAMARDRRAMAFALACAPPVLAAYVAAAVGYAGARSLGEILVWPFTSGFASEGFSRGVPVALYEAVRTAGEGLVSWVPVSRLRAGAALTWQNVLGAIAVLLVLGGAAAGLWHAAHSRPTEGDPSAHLVTRALLGGALLTALFVTWFTPRTIDFWVYVMASISIWACGRVRRVPVLAFAAWLLLLAGVNLFFRVLPMRDPANAPYADLSRFASQHMAAGDRLWIGPEDDALIHALVVLPFFHRVKVEQAGSPEDSAPAGGREFATQTALARSPGLQDGRREVEEVGVLRATPVYRLLPESP
jgi:hypothetical protein